MAHAGGVERERQCGRAFLSRRPADVDMGRRAEELALARHLEGIAVGFERDRGLLELLLADDLVERQVGQRARGVELRVVRLGRLPELEVENELSLRLPLDGCAATGRCPGWP